MATEQPGNSKLVDSDDVVIIPIIKEFATVDKVQSVTGAVTINVTPKERAVSETVELTQVTYREERIATDKIVEHRPEIRYEDGVTIIPVVKEEVVITKRLRLVEEIHLIREEAAMSHTERATIREDEVSIVRE